MGVGVGVQARNTAVGVTYTPTAPVFANTSDSVLGATVTAANTQTLNMAGMLGDSLTVPTVLASGDYDWSSLPGWQYVDDRVAHMRAAGVPLKMITVYSAPLFMLSNPNGDSAATILGNLTTYPVAASWYAAYGSLVHYIVNRYQNFGVMYYSIWAGGYGFVTSGRLGYEAYTQMYNAAWAAVKGDAYTAQAQIGGPGFIFTVAQAGYGYGSAGITPTINNIGQWGAVDPHVTDGFAYWAANATGYDFVTSKMSPLDGGTSNPGGYSPTTLAQYWTDVSSWVWNNIASAQTSGGSTKTVPHICVDGRGFDFTGLALVLARCGTGGMDAFLLYHQQPGVGGWVVDNHGMLTDCGPVLQSYKTSTPPNSRLTGAGVIQFPTLYKPFAAAPALIVPRTPLTVQHNTGSINVTSAAPHPIVIACPNTTAAGNDLFVYFSQFTGSAAVTLAITEATGHWVKVAELTNNAAWVPYLVCYRYAGAPALASATFSATINSGGGAFCRWNMIEVANTNTSAAAEVLFSNYNGAAVSTWTPTASAPAVTGEYQMLAVTGAGSTGEATTLSPAPSLWTPLDVNRTDQNLFGYAQLGTASAPTATLQPDVPNQMAAMIISVRPQ